MNKEQCESENNIVNMDRTTQMIEDDTDNDTIIQLSSELSKVCRCCLENKIDMKSLYESDNFFPDLIMIIAAVVVRYLFLYSEHISCNINSSFLD